MKNPFKNKSLGIKVNNENLIIIITFLRTLGYRWSDPQDIVPLFFPKGEEEKIIYLYENKRLLYGTLEKYIENEYIEVLLSYDDILILMEKCNYEIPSKSK